MLIFFSGVDEVKKNVELFRKKYRKLAFPIYGSQSTKEQDEYL
jgi:HrpA-like RNA helicase